MNKSNKSRGFTLIELLVVIAIIGLLASIVLASLNTARAKARDARRAGDMHSVIQALQLYWLDNNGQYPFPAVGSNNNCAGIYSCLGDLTSVLVPKYIGQLPVDPTKDGTNNNYRYCRVDAAHCKAGGGKCYMLMRQNESTQTTQTWCVPRGLPAPPDEGGNQCWFNNGVPTVPYCGS